MIKKISFTDIDVSADGWIRCNVTKDDGTEQLRIELPYSFKPATDLIASAYASICGSEFDEVQIDLPVGPRQSKLLEDRLRAKVCFRPGTDIRHRPGTEQGLSFSGGFDSLAAREVSPSAHLISLDFGGRFYREGEFFRQFSPLTFRTNLVSLRLNRYSWEFMGIGAMLMRDELGLGTYSFGSIMAGSLPKLFTRAVDQNTNAPVAANALGMKIANPVAGLTEIASLKLVAKNHPELIPQALESLAEPTDDKFVRKHQMVEAVCQEMGLNVTLPPRPSGGQGLAWGTSFATDLSSLYVAKILGADYVSKSYRGGIGDEIFEQLSKIDLGFMDRFNPHAYDGIDPDMLSGWYGRLVMDGVLPFGREDWFEAAKVMKLLRG